MNETALIPVSNMSDVFTMGQFIAQSKLCGASNDAEGFVVATTCIQERMSLLHFSERYHVFNGKISKRADAMLASLLDLGGSYKVLSRTPDEARIYAKYKDAEGEFSFSWADAKEEPFVYAGGPRAQEAELDKPFEKRSLKSKYKTPRSRMQMLWARVISDAVRTVCPLANQGTYTPEEVSDFTEHEHTAAEPKPINADQAMERATAIDVPCVDQTDFNICPIGTAETIGKRWEELPEKILRYALDAENEEITEQHKEAIRNVLVRSM